SVYVDGVTVYEEECTKSVVPSGPDFATTAAPMVPPAPGRFSMTMGCPSWGESLSVTVRAMMSVPLPGVNGTMILIGFAGQACAHAVVCAIHSAIPAASVLNFLIGLLAGFASISTYVSYCLACCATIRASRGAPSAIFSPF